MFEQENALPRSELHFSIENGYGFAGVRQHHPDVRWHVIAALRVVREIIGVVWHDPVEKLFQVSARGRIGIFHDDNAATGVLNEDSDCSTAHTALIDPRLNLIGDFIKTLAVGAKLDSIVMHVHGQRKIRKESSHTKSTIE